VNGLAKAADRLFLSCARFQGVATDRWWTKAVALERAKLRPGSGEAEYIGTYTPIGLVGRSLFRTEVDEKDWPEDLDKAVGGTVVW
jgi:hypothetical protein